MRLRKKCINSVWKIFIENGEVENLDISSIIYRVSQETWDDWRLSLSSVTFIIVLRIMHQQGERGQVGLWRLSSSLLSTLLVTDTHCILFPVIPVQKQRSAGSAVLTI